MEIDQNLEIAPDRQAHGDAPGDQLLFLFGQGVKVNRLGIPEQPFDRATSVIGGSPVKYLVPYVTRPSRLLPW